MSEATEQKFIIQKIYTKNISFESPHTPGIFGSEFKPNLEVNLNVESKGLEESVYHVLLRVTVTTKIEEHTAFLCEVEQAGIFTLEGFNEDELAYLLGAQCPNTLFPYAREAVTDLVTRGGFPQLLLEPVNFEGMYQTHLEETEQQKPKNETAQ